MAPGQCATRPRLRLSEVTLKHSDRYDSIMAQARVLPSLSAAIVHPCSPEAILAAIEVRDEGLLQPLLVGPEAKIQAAAAARAVELAVSGQAAALMKGSFHSDELLGAVVASGSGLTTERRIRHVYAMSLPAYPKPRLVEDLLYRRSGLLGVSGISPDSRDLLDSERPEAHEALDLFCFRIAGEVGRLAATLGGFDAIVFTAGIGEHQPPIRAAVARRLKWLGLELDEAANAANATRISRTDAPVAAFVIPTDEEAVIAEDALARVRPTA